MTRRKPLPANRKTEADDATDIDDYLRSAPEAFLVCRAIGHAWDPTHAGWLRATAGDPWRIELVCLRCEGEAVIYPNVLGGKFERSSKLDAAYYVKGTRLSRNDVRWFMLQQAKDQESPAARKRRKS